MASVLSDVKDLSVHVHLVEYIRSALIKLHMLLFALYTCCWRRIRAHMEPIDEALSDSDLLSSFLFPCNFELYRHVPYGRPKDKVLALDLDQTLVCASPKPLHVHHHWIQTTNAALFVCERPYLRHFLAQVSQWYKVAIFTAGTKAWADPIISHLDPEGTMIEKRYFRQFCSRTKDGTYVKDLSLITTKDKIALSKCILVDDTAVSYQLYPDNAIPIQSFYAESYDADSALLNLLPVLHALQYVQDVRSLLSWRTCQRKECLSDVAPKGEGKRPAGR